MQLYRFSPIETKEKLLEAVAYVASQTTALCRKILDKEFSITSLTIFAHYASEYEKLTSTLSDLGEFYNDNNGPRIALREPISIGKNSITHLRIRRPDPYRTQVGCNDFNVENYATFKQKYLDTHPHSLRLIERKDYEMIEF